jgi:hypothetical protein
MISTALAHLLAAYGTCNIVDGSVELMKHLNGRLGTSQMLTIK